MIGAVDIGGTKIAVGMVDAGGRVVSKEECATDPPEGFERAMHCVSEMLTRTAKKAGVRIKGIGIGSTGPINPVTGLLGNVSTLPGWEGGNPVKRLSDEFDVPTAVENDADAAVLGEAAWGAHRGRARMICITVGTGIGGGILLDGKVYRGADHSHPELGHHVIEASGPACSCGARGCWEALASGPSMVEWIKTAAPADYQLQGLTAKEICTRARAGDQWALRSVEREAYYLGVGLANIVSLFIPDIILLGGSIMRDANLFLDRIHQVIRQNCGLVPHERVELSLASLGPDVGLIGAAQVWYRRFQQSGDRP